MSRYGDDDGSMKAHADWLEDIDETRQLLREGLMELHQRDVPPARAVLAREDDGLMATIHSAVMDFRSLIEPWQDRTETWTTADLGHATIYVSAPSAKQAFKTGNTGRRSADEIDEPMPTESGELRGLDTLDVFEEQRVVFWRSTARGFGTAVYEPDRGRQFMPPSVADRAYRAMNKCLNELNLAADVKQVERIDADPW